MVKNMDNFLSVICTENKTKKDSSMDIQAEEKFLEFLLSAF